MAEGGWGNFSFYHSYAWVTANVATQKVAAEHITEKHRDTFLQTPRKDLSVGTVLEKKKKSDFLFYGKHKLLSLQKVFQYFYKYFLKRKFND